MRRFIFILMIALLPMRGWMGEAMATEMAAMNLVATQAIKTSATADFEVASSMVDCDMNKTQDYEHTPAKSSCTDCQACHATSLVNTVQITRPDQERYIKPLTPIRQLVSANLALSQKPPIL